MSGRAFGAGPGVGGPATRLRAALALAAGSRRGAIGSIVLPALVLLALVGAWELYVDLGGVDKLIVPAPHAVAQALWNGRTLLWSNLGTTAQEIGLGILLALVAGLLVAILIHFSRTARRALYPLTIVSQAIPIPAVAPLLVFWWGFGVLPKLAVIALICFFPIVVTTVDALARVDREQLKLLSTLDASRWQAFRFAEAPAALPAAISGAKIAVAVAAIGAYIAENTTGSSSGLGLEVTQDLSSLQTARAYAAVVVLTAFALACFAALSLAERRLAPWRSQPIGVPA